MNTATSKYPIHPIYQALSEQNKKTLNPVFEQIDGKTSEEQYQSNLMLRSAFDAECSVVVVPETLRSKQEVIGGPNNVKVSTTIFRSLGSQNEVLPVIIFCHGGGWFFYSVDSHAKLISDLCIETHTAVVAVHYSLSPEARFLVANEEAFATLCWIHEHGQSIKVNPDKIAIAGDSVGANMSTVISMMAKDRNMVDAIKAQVLIYPVVTSQDPTKYDSYEAYGQGDLPLLLKMSKVSIFSYLEIPASEYNNRYITPITATLDQLQGLAPALVLTCESDILRDEDETYAAKLLSAGVYTVGTRVLGTVHAYMSFPIPETPQYRFSLQTVSRFLIDQLKIEK